MRFEAELEQAKTWLIVRLPFNVKEAFGSGSIVNVRVWVKGEEFRTSVFPSRGHSHFLMFNKKMQAAAGCRAAGEMVELEIEPDIQPKPVSMPASFKKLLKAKPKLAEFYDSLPMTYKRAYATRIDAAKPAAKAETTKRMLANLELLEIAHRKGLPHVNALLAKSAGVKPAYLRLAPSYRRMVFHWIIDAKSEDARQRRAEKFVRNLASGKQLFKSE